jgi:hypothetical protein
MKIERATYIKDIGRPMLEVYLDGVRNTISAEVKPTLLRYGLVPVERENADRNIEVNGTRLDQVTRNPDLFRLFVAFGLECRHKRFKVGPAVTELDAREVTELGRILAPYGGDDAPEWAGLFQD